MLQGERAAAGALVALARGLGVTAEAAASAEPLPDAFAYCAYVGWLAIYASEAEFAGAFAVMAEGLDRGVDPRQVRRAVRLLQGYEPLYWDTVHHASTT